MSMHTVLHQRRHNGKHICSSSYYVADARAPAATSAAASAAFRLRAAEILTLALCYRQIHPHSAAESTQSESDTG